MHTHDLADRGWEPAASTSSREPSTRPARGATSATLVVGDVTDFRGAVSGAFDFFLDIGCLHVFYCARRAAVSRQITGLARPGAQMLSLAFQPNTLPFVPEGISQEEIEETFADWHLVASEPADVHGMPKPLRKTAPQFYTLHLR